MNVTMIGFAGCGKTSYIAGMYELMSGDGIAGFSIHTSNEVHHRNLLSVGKEIKRGNYPGGTAIHQEYQFTLRYGGNNILPFSWYDYRGGALRERQDRADVQELVARIKASDALIVFFDSNELVSSSSKDVASIRRTITLMQQAISDSGVNSRKFPVSIVVTKGGQNSTDRILESSGMASVKPIFEMVGESKLVHGLFTITEVGPRIYNVHYPFLYSMAFGIDARRVAAANEYNRLIEEGRGYANKVNIVDELFCMFTNDSWSDMARRKLSDAKSKKSLFDNLETPLDNVLSIIKDANGKSIQLF